MKQDGSRQKIMLVDDNKTNLALGKNILNEHYDVYALPSAEKLFIFLNHITPDLILLDIEMPVMNGYDAIRILKEDRRFADIPVVFLTAKSSESDEFDGLALGAIDYVAKPFSPALLLKRIENQLLIQRQKAVLQSFNEDLRKMVEEKTVQVTELQNAIMSNMADLVEFRDNSTGRHISRTQGYLKALMEQLIGEGVYGEELLAWDRDLVLLSSQLHDVGKIAISDTILNKPGKLTPEEFAVMKTHVQRGVEALERMERSGYFAGFLKHAKLFAGTHHEKWDGSGYPCGLKGTGIPLEGRIMAIADVYDALITERPYKKAYSADESARLLIEGAGTHFDPTLIESFINLTDDFAAIAMNHRQ